MTASIWAGERNEKSDDGLLVFGFAGRGDRVDLDLDLVTALREREDGVRVVGLDEDRGSLEARVT